jgi:integral membrane protein (TIGR01906 family)
VKLNLAALRTIGRTILVTCTPLLLLLSNLYVIATPTYINYEYSKPDFPPAAWYDDVERFSLAQATLHYMRSGEDSGYLVSLQSQGQPVYNVREVRHLVDAKRVMRAAFWVHGVCAALLLVAAFFYWRRPTLVPEMLRSAAVGCLVLFTLLAGIGLLAYTDFGLFFTVFHRLFFQGDTWLFPYSDTLIQLFPLPFWMDATFILASLTLGECLLVGTVAWILSRQLKASP